MKFESFSTRDQKQNNNQIKEPRFSPFSFIFFYFLKNQIKFKHLLESKQNELNHNRSNMKLAFSTLINIKS